MGLVSPLVVEKQLEDVRERQSRIHLSIITAKLTGRIRQKCTTRSDGILYRNFIMAMGPDVPRSPTEMRFQWQIER